MKHFARLGLCGTVLMLVVLASEGHTASLSWKGGGANHTFNPQQTTPCTLLVTRDSTLSYIDGFRTVWSGNGRLRFDSPYGQSHIPYSADQGPSAQDRADATCGRETLDLGPAGGASTFDIVVTVLSGDTFDIRMFEVASGRALRWPLAAQASVSINWGSGPSIRPEIIGVAAEVSGDSAQYWVTGLGFALAEHVSLGGVGAPGELPFAVYGDTAIRVVCSRARADAVRSLFVTTAAGVGSSIEADVRSILPATGPAQIVAVLLESAPVSTLSSILGVGSFAPVDPSPSPLGPDGTSVLEDLSQIFVVDVDPGENPETVLASIRSSSNVVSADLVTQGPDLLGDPNDPLWSEQWGLHQVNGWHCSGTIYPEPGSSVEMPSAWVYAQYPPKVDIAIIDTGIELGHPDMLRDDPDALGTSVAPGDTDQWRDYDNHGTPVASIATATSNNYHGLVGASLVGVPVSVKWLGRDENNFRAGGTWPAMTQAIAYAANDSSIPFINISAGGPFISASERTALVRACKNAFLKDKLIVCSAGNSHDSLRVLPAAIDDYSLAVGATLWNNDYWTSANAWYLSADSLRGTAFGSWVDVMAPGGLGITAASNTIQEYYWNLDLQQAYPCDLHFIGDNPYAGRTAFGGTSASAPLVAGIAGWLKKIQPTLTAEDLAQVLRRTATDLGAPGFDVFFGSGRVSGAAAAALVTNPNWIEHGAIGAGGSPILSLTGDSVTTALTVTNATNLGVPNGTYSCVRYRMVGYVTFMGDFTQTPEVWVRRKDTRGLPLISSWDNDQEIFWAGVLGPVSAAAGWFETYVYRLTDYNNVFLPCPPEEARIAYTAIAPSNTLDVPAEDHPVSLAVRTRSAPARYRATFDAAGLVLGPLRVEVFDITGRRMATLFEGQSLVDKATFEWDGRVQGTACRAGIYVCRIEQPGRRAACRFAFIR